LASEVTTYFGGLDSENIWVGDFSFCEEPRRCWDSVICIVIRLRAGRLRNRGSIPGGGKEVFKNIPEGKGLGRKPRKRWLDHVENDLKKWVLEAGEK
jgi:hypothetical protein